MGRKGQLVQFSVSRMIVFFRLVLQHLALAGIVSGLANVKIERLGAAEGKLG